MFRQKKSLELLRIEAAWGMEESRVEVASHYLKRYANAVPAMDMAGIQILQHAADQGNTMAMNRLAYLYLNDIIKNGVDMHAKGVKLLEAAIAKGDAEAMSNLAIVHINQLSNIKDEQVRSQQELKVMSLLTKAAELNDPMAKRYLSSMLQSMQSKKPLLAQKPSLPPQLDACGIDQLLMAAGEDPVVPAVPVVKEVKGFTSTKRKRR